MKFFEGCFTGNKSSNFGADLDHDSDPGILPLQDISNCQNVVGSAAFDCIKSGIMDSDIRFLQKKMDVCR